MSYIAALDRTRRWDLAPPIGTLQAALPEESAAPSYLPKGRSPGLFDIEWYRDPAKVGSFRLVPRSRGGSERIHRSVHQNLEIGSGIQDYVLRRLLLHHDRRHVERSQVFG